MNVENIFRVKLENSTGDLVCGTFCDLVLNLFMSNFFSCKLNLYISGQHFSFLIVIPVSCKSVFLSQCWSVYPLVPFSVVVGRKTMTSVITSTLPGVTNLESFSRAASSLRCSKTALGPAMTSRAAGRTLALALRSWPRGERRGRCPPWGRACCGRCPRPARPPSASGAGTQRSVPDN